MEVKWFSGAEDLSDALFIREEVFTKEQGFAAPDTDERDPACAHLVLYDGAHPAATGRIYCENGVWHPGRLAVLREYRGRQLGRILLDELERFAAAQGACRFSLSAQLYAVPFYEKCGYKPTGERHMDEFCEHETMTKEV